MKWIFQLSLLLLLSYLSGCDDDASASHDAGDLVNLGGTDIAGADIAGTDTAGTDTAGTDTAGTDTAGAGDTGLPPAEWVDLECIDGQYRETLPSLEVDLSEHFDRYTEEGAIDFILTILNLRYPLGEKLVEEGQMGRIGDCVEFFLRDRSSPTAIIRQLTTIVHECGHFVDLANGGLSESHYVITDELSFTCSGGDTNGRGGNTFARSRINNDSYALEACSRGADCDFYRSVYLDGDPDNYDFEGGDQGYNSVLEETTQYINSLAVAYAFNDYYSASVSERDGILTFLWYVTRYLKMAREDYPQAYNFILNNDCWRELTLTLWGRAWRYLELTDGMNTLGINDRAIKARLTNDLVSEIDRLRELQCR